MSVHDLMLKPAPTEKVLAKRRTKAYVAQFADREPPCRAIHRKCLECMGAELRCGKLPRGNSEAVRAVDECSSVNCPLWPFRNGTNPWREGRRTRNADPEEEVPALEELKKAA